MWLLFRFIVPSLIFYQNFMPFPTSKEELEKELLELQVQCDILRYRINMRHAEEIVRESGLSEKDEDFLFECEMETRRLWDEETEWEREREEEHFYDELRREEQEKFFLKHAKEK